MTNTHWKEWLWPCLLIVLSIVPVLAGAVRIGELSGNGEITSANARFMLSPLPVVFHIFSATIYCILGAFQFVPRIRRSKLQIHKFSGLLLIPCGLLSAATGLWMTQFYSGSEYNSLALYWLRILVGAAMITAIFLSLKELSHGRYRLHGTWMIRAYALGIGAGTQAFTAIPLFIFQLGNEIAVFIHMAAGWGINVIVAEWVIRRRKFGEEAKKIKKFTLTS